MPIAVASGPSTLIKDHLAGGASRLAALLLPQILPVFSVVAPCHPGAALRDLVLVQRGPATSLQVGDVRPPAISSDATVLASSSDGARSCDWSCSVRPRRAAVDPAAGAFSALIDTMRVARLVRNGTHRFEYC